WKGFYFFVKYTNEFLIKFHTFAFDKKICYEPKSFTFFQRNQHYSASVGLSAYRKSFGFFRHYSYRDSTQRSPFRTKNQRHIRERISNKRRETRLFRYYVLQR